MNKEKEKIAEEKIKNHVREFVKEHDLISQKDNVVFAEKAFKCNGIIRWCIWRRYQKLITNAGVEKHYRAMDRFIKGEVDLIWHPKGYVQVKQRKQNLHLMSNND